MHKNLSVLSLTTLRFLISSWKHIPSITALHQAMSHFLGEHPFTEWTQHGNGNDRGFGVTLTSLRL